MARAVQENAKQKKAKRKKQGAAAIAALGKSGLFTGANKDKKVEVEESVPLRDFAEGKDSPGTTRIVKTDKAATSSKGTSSEEGGPQLGKNLAGISANFGDARGEFSSIVKSSLSGAAIGATIGEAIDARRKKKRAAEKKS